VLWIKLAGIKVKTLLFIEMMQIYINERETQKFHSLCWQSRGPLQRSAENRPFSLWMRKGISHSLKAINRHLSH
jgi:hypothetical protein